MESVMRINFSKFMVTAVLAISIGAPAAYAKTHVQTSASDLALAQTVELQLKSSGVLEKGLTDVTVKSENGNIVLSGWLQHADDARKVIAAAKNIEGVGSVKANFRTWSSRRHPS
jgi:osmotically-inducible protein OsmY